MEEADRVAEWECLDVKRQFNKPCHVIYVGGRGTVSKLNKKNIMMLLYLLRIFNTTGKL